MDFISRYKTLIYERFFDLKNGSIIEPDNYQLAKIFEYYCCIKLSEEVGQIFLEYNDISPDFKEQNHMSKNDTGIDLSNTIDTIVQCKLRKNNLTWQEISTFFGSNICLDENGLNIKWKKMIIARNTDSQLSANLRDKQKLFIDKLYDRAELLDYCRKVLEEKLLEEEIKQKIILRDYQKECIELIQNSDKNVIICLPTGTGKNVIMIHSFEENCKYLILVPRIILMDQLCDEIIKHDRKLLKNIQLIGDGNNFFDKNKNITICVYNSVEHILSFIKSFDKIYIDEAHHIYKPEIYSLDEIEIGGKDKNYLATIRKFSKYNNNVYLSATIDKINGFHFYKKDIRDMINQNYLTDYTIHIPVFSNNPDNTNICQYLLQNYRNIIVYCNSRSEGKQITELFNKLQSKSAEYIDCETNKKDRKEILKKYNDGNIPFLVNVKVLCEGFDSAITRGVCFLHLSSSKTTVIQIIGRALRLHPLKTIANVILPFSLTEDEKSITNFMKILASNDERIKKSYVNHVEGGYLNITKMVENDEDCLLRSEMIYDSMGNNLRLNFDEWKELLFKYCDENEKAPSHKQQYKNKNLGTWYCRQKQQINNINDKLYIILAENKYVKESLNRYLENKNKDKKKLTFDQSKLLLFKYCSENKKVPSVREQYENVKLGMWYSNQKKKINNLEDQLYKTLSTENNIIKENLDKYLKFKNKNKDKKILTFDQSKKLLFKYCNESKKIPHSRENAGRWYAYQKNRINNAENKFYTLLSENRYIKEDLDRYLKAKNRDKKRLTLDQSKKILFKYCNENKKVPQHKEQYENMNLGGWYGHQKEKLNNSEDILYKTLAENKYVKQNLDKYLESKNKDKKKLTFEQSKKLLFKYCNENKKTPPKKDQYEGINLGMWYQSQKKKINDFEDNFYVVLSENKYIKQNLNQYLEFKNKNKKKSTLDESKKLLFKYCNENKKIPPTKEQYENINIGQWYCARKIKINNPEDELYIILSENKYIKENLDRYLQVKNKDKKRLTFDQSKKLFFKYCNENKKVPPSKEQYEGVNIGMWYCGQKKKINNFEDKIYIILAENKYVKENLDKFLEIRQK